VFILFLLGIAAGREISYRPEALPVTTFFEVKYLLKNGSSYGQNYYSRVIGNHT